jgi:hypothetical protein
MKRGLALAALSVLAAGLFAGTAEAAGGPENFRAHLTGAGEVPPVDTAAQGQAIFQLSPDDTALSYRLIVTNIENAVQAHIHCGAADVNGPVVAFLFGPVPEGMDNNGVLATGTITNANVIPVPDSAACPGGVANFDEMIAKIRSGDAYVNAHTVQNPGGEIRGEL